MSLHSFSHVCESIYHFFFYQSLQAAVCVISVRVGVDSNNAFSLFSFFPEWVQRERKTRGKREKNREEKGRVEKKRARLLVDYGAVTFSTKSKLKNIQ